MGVVVGGGAWLSTHRFVVLLPAMLVVQGAYRQLLVPDPVQGRVASIARIAAWSAQSAGAALAGMLLQSVGGEEPLPQGSLPSSPLA